ncbi:MAG TPA: glycosyltransferase family 4 protein [Bacteroidia bacterium]|nr:glycosyltransferase family 4 protein [Bacteroidia bacterium]
MPKILRIINRFNLGGPTYNVAYLSRFLAPEFETMLVGGAKDETEGSSEFIVENLGLKPVILPEMRREISPVQDLKAYHKIKSLIREFRPDIVHTHASKAGALGRMAAASCKVPVIVHTFHGHVFHSYFGKYKSAFYKTAERYLARKCNAIIAVSEKQKHELVVEHRICEAEKVHVIPLGFDLSRFQEESEMKRQKFRSTWQLSEKEVAVVIIGRLVPVKNHSLFLRALKKVMEKSAVPVRGFIIGDGEMRPAIEAEAIAVGFDFTKGSYAGKKALTFTSWIKDVDIALAGSDVVCLSSWNEGTPVSLIEAQAAGKPIVATNVGGVTNVVIPGVTGLLSDPGNEEKFAENLLALVENPDLRQSMGTAGWPNVGERFHYMRLVNDTETLYKQLLIQAK